MLSSGPTTLGRELMNKVRAVAGAAIAMLCSLTAFGTTSQAAQEKQLPYENASLPVSQRVDDLMSRMTLQDKIGQMTQTERYQVFGDETPITTYRLGSILSGGGSTPPSNTPEAWADMIDRFQRAALKTPLHIPILYGIDSVHGDGNLR